MLKAMLASLARAVLAGALALPGAVSACDRDGPPLPPRDPPPQRSAGSERRALPGFDADIPELADPLVALDAGRPTTTTVRDDVAGFTTVEACVATHARLDSLLADALEAIGYDAFVRDACRVIDAAKARDRRRCESIDASSLRLRCVATVAQLEGEPDACPWEVEGRPEIGRDPACLAIAARDPRLCAGEATTPARATCEAEVLGQTSPCAKLVLASDQARCLRAEARWIGAAPPDAGAVLRAAEGKLRIEPDDGGAPLEVSLEEGLARGVVVVEHTHGIHLQLGPSPDEMGAISTASLATPGKAGSAVISVELEGEPPGLRVLRAELSLGGDHPGLAALGTPSLDVSVEKLEPVRGGTVSLKLEGTLGASGARVRAQVVTFVRDVVTAREAMGLSAAPKGSMR